MGLHYVRTISVRYCHRYGGSGITVGIRKIHKAAFLFSPSNCRRCGDFPPPPPTMSDSKYFTTTKKGEIKELKRELDSPKENVKKDAVKKVL